MNVLSVFDGISCGQLALKRAGIKVNKYYASEIDKYAIKITMNKNPDTIQLGDIAKVSYGSGGEDTGLSNDKFYWPCMIDLLIGGSPCQGFSFAGKQLNFEDPRSKLFFEFIRLLKEIRVHNPNVKFLLENVKMKKEYQDVISDLLGVQPIEINSALVSAQNRKRLYWTNIKGVGQPEDKGILLKDILLNSKNNYVYQFPHGCSKGGIRDLPKISCVTKQFHNNFFKLIHSEKAIQYMNRVEPKSKRTKWDFKFHSDINDDKSACVVANFFKGIPNNVLKDLECIRKFHPVECERLQTIPDNYTEGISDTQRYKSIGNGWTIDVISHIFSYINIT